MAFDKEEFRRKAEAKAKAAVAKKRQMRESGEVVGIANAPAEQSNIEGKLPSGVLKVTEEEKKVLDAYRKWKETRTPSKKSLKEEEGGEDTGAEAPAANPMPESKEQRIARLKRKIERRRRVDELKVKLAEKRNAEKPDAIREQAQELKERIQKVRTQLRSMKEEGEMPMAPPAGAATAPMGAADPNADPNAMPGAIPNLPPEITAEIQNIATAAQALAQMAGVAPAAPQPGADLNAGIPPETGDASGAGMLPESAKRERIARIKALLEKKKAEKKGEKKDDEDEKKGKKAAPFGKKKEEVEEENEDDKMIENARARAAQRREALQKIRAKAMTEKSYDPEEKGAADTQEYIKSAMDSGGAMGDKGYGFIHDNAIQKAGVKHDGPSPSMPGKAGATGSISPARVWPAKDLSYGGKVPEKMPSTPDYNAVKKAGGQPHMPGTGDKGAVVKESTEEAWDQRQIDHFIERKELNFKKLLESGQLG